MPYGFRAASKAVRAAASIAAGVGLLVIAAASPALAAAGPWGKSDYLEARIVSAVEATGDLAAVSLGVELNLQPGWKTYWRSPGDAGLPPEFDWSKSQNVAKTDVSYPLPHRVTLLGLQTFGYSDQVVFPIALTPKEKGKPLDLKLSLTALVCENICVPQTLELALALPAGPATPGPEAQLVDRFQAAVPRDGAASGMTIRSASETSLDGKAAIAVEVQCAEVLKTPDVFVEIEPQVAFAAAKVVAQNGDVATLVTPLVDKLPPGQTLTGRSVTLTAVDGERSAEAKKTVGAAALGGTAPTTSIVAMLGLALLGGLILNLMPCVLPVLSLKLFGLAKFGGAAPAAVRAGFLASAAGIVVSFIAIAGALIALQAAGQTIGWGIQFQQPVFIVAIVAVLTLFACNLWGFFEIPLPGFVAAGADRIEGRQGLAGHFGTGVLATLLATPCSAPFLGTAVGFALASGPLMILAIFVALGVGVAAPYLAVAAFPAVARFVPKPGMWMIRLKVVLGFALALTAVWLLGVLVSLAGWPATAIVSGLMLAVVALTAFRARTGAPVGPFAPAGAAVLIAAALLSPSVAPAPRTQGDVAEEGGRIPWQAFDRAKVRSLVSQGKTVLVDVTADWCVTCQANKRIVINRSPVVDRLAKDVTAVKADWTRPDPEISAFLASYGKYGIPFNIVYGPGAPTGIVLPELLTPDAVVSALDRAQGAQGAR